MCYPGFYCPTPQNMTKCPAGSYCIKGSSAPRTCPELSSCPEGTEMRQYYGAVIYAVIIDIIMLVVYLYLKFYYEPRQWRKRSDARRARLQRDESMQDLTMSPNTTAVLGHDFLPSDSTVPLSVRHLSLARDAKDILEAGFRDCNQGLRLELDFEGLGLTLPAPVSRTILRGVRGRIRPGRVTAVMGPSGAGKWFLRISFALIAQAVNRARVGKTTFLSVLMGKVQRTSGQLKINGARK